MNTFTFARHHSGTWTMECNDTILVQGSLREVDALASRLSRALLLPRAEFEAFRRTAGIKSHPIFGDSYPGEPAKVDAEAWSRIVD